MSTKENNCFNVLYRHSAYLCKESKYLFVDCNATQTVRKVFGTPSTVRRYKITPRRVRFNLRNYQDTPSSAETKTLNICRELQYALVVPMLFYKLLQIVGYHITEPKLCCAQPLRGRFRKIILLLSY